LENRIGHTIATAATAKEPDIMPGRTLLGMKGTNVDHMTCISINKSEKSRSTVDINGSSLYYMSRQN
jgi:hypothetical protein